MISIMKNISVSVFSPPPPPPSLSYIILEKSAGMLPNSEQYCMKNVGWCFNVFVPNCLRMRIKNNFI